MNGLQRERTRLAWRRTTLSGAVVGTLLATRLGQAAPTVPAVVGGLVVVLVWSGLVLLAEPRIRALNAGAAGTPGPAPVAVVAAVVIFGLVGVVAVLR
jgi:uncharacterized membrane protein